MRPLDTCSSDSAVDWEANNHDLDAGRFLNIHVVCPRFRTAGLALPSVQAASTFRVIVHGRFMGSSDKVIKPSHRPTADMLLEI